MQLTEFQGSWEAMFRYYSACERYNQKCPTFYRNTTASHGLPLSPSNVRTKIWEPLPQLSLNNQASLSPFLPEELCGYHVTILAFTFQISAYQKPGYIENLAAKETQKNSLYYNIQRVGVVMNEPISGVFHKNYVVKSIQIYGPYTVSVNSCVICMKSLFPEILLIWHLSYLILVLLS